MDILLWVLQVLLALHTVMGAVWKISHSAAATMPSLAAIPSGVWRAMAVVEVVCGIGLVLPYFYPELGMAAPVAAFVISAEMLVFCALHLKSGAVDKGPLVYWLVVAALCDFTAFGRIVLQA